MTNKEAGYIIGTLKDNDEYDICQIQEAKGKAVDLLFSNTIKIPDGATNGEVILALFPHDYYGWDVEFSEEWWNSPYKEADE